MMLSKNTVDVLVDLIENKLAVMHIGNRDDLRDMVTLQRCLSELQGLESSALESFNEIPRRGRHRKVADMIEELEREQQRA
jgi:hypothetical protein